MTTQWNKIDWEKTEWYDEKLSSEKDTDAEEVWEVLFHNAGIETDGYGMSLLGDKTKFTWEDGMKCGLPKKQGKYWCLDENMNIFLGEYDDENTTPCFWDESEDEPVFPDYWAEVELPE